MSLRTVVTGFTVPFVLLACSASAPRENASTQGSDLQVSPYPGLLTPCGARGEACCASANPLLQCDANASAVYDTHGAATADGTAREETCSCGPCGGVGQLACGSSQTNRELCAPGLVAGSGTCLTCAEVLATFDVTVGPASYNGLDFTVKSAYDIRWGWKFTGGDAHAQQEIPPGSQLVELPGGEVDGFGGSENIPSDQEFTGPPYALYPDSPYQIAFYAGGLHSPCPPVVVDFYTAPDRTPTCLADHNCNTKGATGDNGGSNAGGGGGNRGGGGP